MENLFERAGGHYVDMGSTSLIASGAVGIRSGVVPTAYTASGLRLSDGSEISADAIVFCTGYADKNLSEVATSVFGSGGEQLAEKMDGTWGLDSEGEVRGLWKRQEAVEQFWIMGGFTSQHRFYSKFLALQLKAALEGALPAAYRETPAGYGA